MEAVRTVGEVMAQPVVVQRATTIQDASAAMLDAGVEMAVVTDAGVVKGVVTAQDVGRALAEGHDAARTPVDRICNHDPLLTGPEEAVAVVHERMRAEHQPVAVAVGPDGEPLGLLTDSM